MLCKGTLWASFSLSRFGMPQSVAAAYRRGESERKAEERQRVEAEEYQALVRAWRSLFKG